MRHYFAHFGAARRPARRCTRRRQRRGVLLLIVVACILIAGLAMVGVARQSLRLATDSVQLESELQQRWGTISLQRTLLRSAPGIFADLDKRSLAAGNTGPFPSTVRSEILLGGIKFDVLLADEQAKLNLNSTYHQRGRATAEQLAGKLKGVPGLRVRILPEVASDIRGLGSTGRHKAAAGETDDSEIPAPPAAFRHWGQVFDLSHSASGVTASQLVPAATARITCWGHGEVNIARAPDDVVEETCRAVLGPGVARKLVRQYRENSMLNVKQIALQLEVNERDMNALGQLVTTQSSTYSLWLNSTSLIGTQRWFAVAARVGKIGVKTERFPY